MLLMRITYYIYAEDEKLVQELEKAVSKALARSMYPHLTEDSEIFFRSSSDGALSSRNTTDNQSSFEHRRGSQPREELGCRKRL